MKKLFLLIAVLMAASMTMAQEDAHRYEIKSGIAHGATILNDHATPSITYFDDYGAVESMVQTIDMGDLGSFDNTTVTKGEKAWFINPSGKSKEFTNPIYDLTFINPSEAVVEKYQLVDTGREEEFLGRTCKIFTYQTSQGRKTAMITAWVYKGITLKSIAKVGRRETIFELTELQENVEVPAETFVIPE